MSEVKCKRTTCDWEHRCQGCPRDPVAFLRQQLAQAQAARDYFREQADHFTARCAEQGSAIAALTEQLSEAQRVFMIDRDHELTGPKPGCGCPSCNLHHKYAFIQGEIERTRAVVEAAGEVVRNRSYLATRNESVHELERVLAAYREPCPAKVADDTPCPKCNGDGYIFHPHAHEHEHEVCPECSGHKYVRKDDGK